MRFTINPAKVLAVLILSVPALMSFVRPSNMANENRHLASLPAMPADWDQALQYPGKLDLWINDHFGFRQELVILNNRIRYALFRQFPTIQVIEGKSGRIFLSSHATTHQPYSAISWTCGYSFRGVDAVVDHLNTFASMSRRTGLDAKLIIAPSSPSVYTGELPGWLAERCKTSVSPIPSAMSSQQLDAAAKSIVYYPLDDMRRMEPGVRVIPKTWFHWAGTGPSLIAQYSVQRFWDIAVQDKEPIVTMKKTLPSDLSHLFPGIVLESEIDVADFAASDITECIGPQCFPEMDLERLGHDVARYRNEKRPSGRLVLVTDSFGRYIAGWYARYFREVLLVSTNAIEQLEPAQIQKIKQAFLVKSPENKIIFLYHDGSVLDGRIALDMKRLAL